MTLLDWSNSHTFSQRYFSLCAVAIVLLVVVDLMFSFLFPPLFFVFKIQNTSNNFSICCIIKATISKNIRNITLLVDLAIAVCRRLKVK